MVPKFQINDAVRHVETGEIYIVVDIKIEKYQVFYKLKTDEEIIITTVYPETILELNT